MRVSTAFRTDGLAVAILVVVALSACQKPAEPAATATPAEPAVETTAQATPPPDAEPVPTDAVAVNADTFGRAETDMAFAGTAKTGGFGQFHHNREMTPLDKQVVVRQNRDTLYSAAVFDLDAGPVTITLPDPGKRFMSMQVFDEDQYTHQVTYKPGTYTLRKEDIGTRYVMAALRILANPGDAADMQAVHALQDQVKVSQPGGPGKFEVPKWNTADMKKVRDALTVLGDGLPDKNHMFGSKAEVDPVRRLIGVATAWGGNPEKDATYLNVTPQRNDGQTVHRLTVKDVPVDGFWSITVYNDKGYFEKNTQDMYSVNNLTAQKAPDGSVMVQFGGCDGQAVNCLPITKGWNYLVRLYRPRTEILKGTWKFPEAAPVSP